MSNKRKVSKNELFYWSKIYNFVTAETIYYNFIGINFSIRLDKCLVLNIIINRNAYYTYFYLFNDQYILHNNLSLS